MNRSFFRRTARDSSPLLPQHSSVPLAELLPRPYSDTNAESEPANSHVSTSSSPPSRRPRVQFSHPPPPITASALLQPLAASPPPSRSSTAAHAPSPTNPLAALIRREKALQTDLQRLLDAQSEALLAGRLSGQDGSAAASDAGSSTPTSYATARRRDQSQYLSGAVTPVRQPRPKKLSLRGSRRGIFDAMQELAAVKAQVLSILRAESENLRMQLARIDVWGAKISRFETEIRRIANGGDDGETADLRAEKAAVENEIHELEERLLALRARERHLGRRLEESSNRLEADLSSFREGKRGVEEEVKRFLGRPPKLDIALFIAAEKNIEVSGGDSEGTMFLNLPPNRRTLGMARGWLTPCLSAVSSLTASAEAEKEALEEGARMWENIVKLVTTFENELREQLKEGREISDEDVERQLQKTDASIETLESTSSDAAKRGWNLLICAIGAELEAFREGKGVLRSILGKSGALQQSDDGDLKVANILMDDGMTRESLAHPALELNHDVNNSDQTHDIYPLADFGIDVGDIDHKQDPEPETTPPIVLDGLQTASAPRNGDEELQNLTVPSRGEGTGANVSAGIGVGHAHSISQIYNLSPGHGLLRSHSPRDKNGERESSPYRSESEDDGPPAAFLVGLQDEDY